MNLLQIKLSIKVTRTRLFRNQKVVRFLPGDRTTVTLRIRKKEERDKKKTLKIYTDSKRSKKNQNDDEF